MRSIAYYWKEGLRNIFKHGFMSVAAVVIMVVSLLLTGTVTLVAYNITNNITRLQQSNQIVVWIDDSLTTREAKTLQTQFEKIDNIASIAFEDRDVADATIKEIEAVDGVASVRADEDVIRKLIQIQRVFNMIAAAMIVGLAVISIFIISNTVKLAMFARREEISIQKMVGATNWFIRWPFVIEGMVLGLVAGGLAFLAEWGLYTELYNVAGTVSLSSFHLLSFDVLRWWVLGVYCGAGALFGIGGSVTSIRKFMDV